ncbi:hypothetical protein HNR31_002757 [Anoxybacillus caldiproteolyticus]|uniref:Uncharacterized protein n=1 Tax=Thermaerobacillus caldiproteolyticus TaxID=247480 RepID=A0A7W0BZE6_9BACL|nr:hypothetical protein [Anoxybacillus caldiproteolyticus]
MIGKMEHKKHAYRYAITGHHQTGDALKRRAAGA